MITIAVEEYTGERDALRWSFELAEDSESELLSYMHSKHQDLLDTIRTKKDLGPVEADLKSALAAFAEAFA